MAFLICNDFMNEVFVSPYANNALGSSAGKLYLTIGFWAPSGVAVGKPTLSYFCPRVGSSLDTRVSQQGVAVSSLICKFDLAQGSHGSGMGCGGVASHSSCMVAQF